MPYVQRDGNKIIALYGQRQAGFAEEHLPDTDPEVVAFLTPPPPQPDKVDRLILIMKGKGALTQEDLDTIDPKAVGKNG